MPPTQIDMLKSHFDFKWLTAAALCTLSVLTLTHLPQDPTPESLRSGFFHIDKAEHVLAYGAITAFFVLALRTPTPLRMLLLALLGVAVIGMIDELTQPLVNRVYAIADFLANLAGIALCGVLLAGRRLAARQGFDCEHVGPIAGRRQPELTCPSSSRGKNTTTRT